MDKTKNLLAMVVQDHQAAQNEVNRNAAIRMAVLGILSELGGLTVSDDSLVFEGNKLILPAQYEGRIDDAIEYLKHYQEMQEKHYKHSQSFRYRPLDGAAAFDRAMRRVFGSTGIGKDTYTMFGGKNPPELRTIESGVGTTIQVPWGQVEFSQLEAVFGLGIVRDKEYGILFNLAVDAPKKYQKHIAAFFQVVEEELRDNSIYKGKAITGAEDPGFLDVSRIDPDRVIYSTEVQTQLEANLWAFLKYSDTMRDLNVPLKRAVLVEGPYGTGKTLAGMLTAQHAEKHGWTFILCRPDQDDLFNTLRTAQLYAPAVVWFEDIDTIASGGTDSDISRLLDALDGISAKGAEVIAGFTTNHAQNIQKGVLRPGRVDAMISIGDLDDVAFRKLVNNIIPSKLLGSIDYDLVAKAYRGFMPAFVAEGVRRAMIFTLARNNGATGVIETDDLINSALALRPQFDLMNSANEGANAPTIDGLLEDMVADTLNRTVFADDNNGQRGLYVQAEDRKFGDYD